MKAILFLLISLFWTGALMAQVTLKEELAALYQTTNFPGWAIAAVDNEDIIFSHAEGYADIERGIPFSKQTVINIASVSKTMVGHAVMSAVIDGLFSLDTPINSLLPFAIQHPDFPETEITIIQLVGHTSGIRDRQVIYYLQGYIDEGDQDISLDEFMRRYFSPAGKWNAQGNFNNHQPGTHYEYTNIGAALAAWIIELQTGIPFYEYSTRKTLVPIGMEASGWRWEDIDEVSHAVNYNKKNKIIAPYHLATYPDGGLRSNLLDLSKYLIEMININNKSSNKFPEIEYSQLFNPLIHQPLDGLSQRLTGVGVFWSNRSNGLIGHTGGDPGVSSFLFFNPETGIGRVMLINTDIKTDKQTQQFLEIWNTVGKVYK